jgi:hypothetical protein
VATGFGLHYQRNAGFGYMREQVRDPANPYHGIPEDEALFRTMNFFIQAHLTLDGAGGGDLTIPSEPAGDRPELVLLHWDALMPKPRSNCCTIRQAMTLRFLAHLRPGLLAETPLRSQILSDPSARNIDSRLYEIEVSGGPYEFTGIRGRIQAWHTAGISLKAAVDCYLDFARANRDLRSAILWTGDRYLHFASPHPFWGIGLQANHRQPRRGIDGGANWLGIAIMLAREILREEEGTEEGNAPAPSPDDVGDRNSEEPGEDDAGSDHAGQERKRALVNPNSHLPPVEHDQNRGTQSTKRGPGETDFWKGHRPTRDIEAMDLSLEQLGIAVQDLLDSTNLILPNKKEEARGSRNQETKRDRNQPLTTLPTSRPEGASATDPDCPPDPRGNLQRRLNFDTIDDLRRYYADTGLPVKDPFHQKALYHAVTGSTAIPPDVRDLLEVSAWNWPQGLRKPLIQGPWPTPEEMATRTAIWNRKRTRRVR